MQMEVLQGILIPFLGTTLGSACVLFMKKSLNPMLQRALTGFAAGVMVAASIWSLLIPAMEQSQSMGQWAFVPAAVGFWHHGHRCAGSFHRDRHTKLPGRCNHLHAPAGGGRQQGKSVPFRCAFRCCGAGGRGADHTRGGICGSAPAVSFKFCGRSHGLCGSGGTGPRDVGGEALQRGNCLVCGRFYGHDGAGCGTGIGEMSFAWIWDVSSWRYYRNSDCIFWTTLQGSYCGCSRYCFPDYHAWRCNTLCCVCRTFIQGISQSLKLCEYSRYAHKASIVY